MQRRTLDRSAGVQLPPGCVTLGVIVFSSDTQVLRHMAYNQDQNGHLTTGWEKRLIPSQMNIPDRTGKPAPKSNPGPWSLTKTSGTADDGLFLPYLSSYPNSQCSRLVLDTRVFQGHFSKEP